MAEKLRRGRLAAGVITVFVHTDRFAEGPQYYNAGTHTLAYPTDSTQELLRCALDALERVYMEGFDYRKAGVMLHSLSPVDQLTLRMFGDEKAERFRQVMVAVDRINRRWAKTRYASPWPTPKVTGGRSSRSARRATPPACERYSRSDNVRSIHARLFRFSRISEHCSLTKTFVLSV